MVLKRTADRRRGRSLRPTSTLLWSLLPGALPARAANPECSASVPPVLKHHALDASSVCGPLIDDSVAGGPADHSPWTHAPVCEVSAADAAKKFCVYTNTRHGRRGISLLARPEVAADSIGILDEYLNATAPEDEPFKIVDVPGKGKGVVATRHIKRYETIMTDYSVLLIDMAFASEVPTERGYKLLHRAVDGLADPESVRALGQSNGLAKDPIENVLRTNGFHTVLSGEQHMALYPIVSRINHACKPNAYTRFSPQSLQTIAVSAARDISPGEEITISYISLGQPTPERTRALALWSFTCTCDLCTAPPATLAASDARRTEIERLRDAAITAFQAGHPRDALRLTQHILTLLPAEELFPLYAEQYENIARIYYVLRDRDNAHRYATLALETLVAQGYLGRVRAEHYEAMWRRFEAEEGGRY